MRAELESLIILCSRARYGVITGGITDIFGITLTQGLFVIECREGCTLIYCRSTMTHTRFIK